MSLSLMRQGGGSARCCVSPVLEPSQSFAPGKLPWFPEHGHSYQGIVKSCEVTWLSGTRVLWLLVQNEDADGALTVPDFSCPLVAFVSLLPNPGSHTLSEAGAFFCVSMRGSGKRVLAVCALTSKGFGNETVVLQF